MPKLRWPPGRLPEAAPGDLVTVREGQIVWRVYRSGGAHPTSWNAFRSYGPVAPGRFDHHDPPGHDDPHRAILYVALDGPAAIAEAFQSTRTIERDRDDPYLVGFDLELGSVALDLGGLWPTRAGCSQAISSGRRDIARAWSRAIYDAYPEVQALRYPSSMSGGSLSLALYERANGHIPYSPRVHLPLTHPGLDLPLRRIATRLGYDLV